MVYVLVFLAGLLFAAPASAQCIGALQSGNNLSDVCDASTARTSLGLGSIATQASNSISVTGGTATGLTGLGMTSTGAFYGASGTTAERPTATAGGIRFNSTTGLPEYANGSSWTSFGTGGTVTSVSAGAGMDFSTITGTGSVAASANTRTSGWSIIIDGGGSAITTGAKTAFQIPFGCTVSQWQIVADQSGSIVVDIKKASYNGAFSTIAGTEKPTLSSAQWNQDTSLTSFTTSVTAQDWWQPVVDSATTVTWVSIGFVCLKS